MRWRLIAGGPPFLHPGRAAEVVVDAREAGWLGELHPGVAADFGLDDLERPPALLELDLGVVLPAAERVTRRYEDLITYPAVVQDIAVVVDEAVEAHSVVDTVAAAGGDELRSVRVFDVYRGDQVGEGRKSLALRLEFRSSDRTLTDAEVAERRAGSGTRSRTRPGGRCVSRVQAGAAGRSQTLAGEPLARACVVGASGFAGALAAAILWAHPRVSLEAVTARTEAGRRLDDLYPRHRVPLELEPFDAERLAEAADVALVSYPHGAAAEVVAALRGHGVRVVDLSADFRLSDQALHERWYGPRGAPDLVGEAVFGLTELHRDEVAAASLVANPGCYSTAAILALAPLARQGLIADAVVDAKSGVSGAGRAANDRTHFVSVDENVSAYAVDGHRHAPEVDQELAALGCDARVTFMPHLLPLDQGLLASCYVTPTRAHRRRRGGVPVRRVLRGRAVHRAGRAAARRARRPRHEPVPDPRHQPPGRPGGHVRRDRQSVEGRGGAGRAEPERDARRRRDGGPVGERERHLLPLPLGGRSAGRHRARAGRAARRAFARPALPVASSPPGAWTSGSWHATARPRRRRCSPATRWWRRRWSFPARQTCRACAPWS